ncbi:hypothetical protein BD410DRAFT_744906, partial [Rickenella mellea]
SSSIVPLPAILRKFFYHFPLHTYPPIPPPQPYGAQATSPTLWISPPRQHFATDPSANVLSADVECLKWQAYLALRGVSEVALRWDVNPAGAPGARLPALQVPGISRSVLAAREIPTWVDAKLGRDDDGNEFEGYLDAKARDESRAWVALLEGAVHAALILHNGQPPSESAWTALLWSPIQSAPSSLAALLTPPPPPLSGLTSLLPPYGERISPSNIQLQYQTAIVSLSDRLGTDKWFLGSSGPTALDALIFAYLHTLLNAPGPLRIEVNKRANLVAWELRVRGIVQPAFHIASRS